MNFAFTAQLLAQVSPVWDYIGNEHWLPWTTFVAVIELFYLLTGHMIYHPPWRFWHSYIADWALFSSFVSIYLYGG
jgi:hypothetical protein